MSANIYKAINEVMKEVGYVQKTGKNEYQGYRYAGEADLLAAIRPAMVKVGLVLIPRMASCSGPDANGITTVVVDYRVAHVSGEHLDWTLTVAGQGGDKNSKGVGDKGVYKALTGANKYALFKLFQIETGDDPESSEAPNEGGERPKPVEKPKGPPATARRPSDETVPF